MKLLEAIYKLETIKEQLDVFEYDVNQKSFIKEDLDEVIEMIKGEL